MPAVVSPQIFERRGKDSPPGHPKVKRALGAQNYRKSSGADQVASPLRKWSSKNAQFRDALVRSLKSTKTILGICLFKTIRRFTKSVQSTAVSYSRETLSRPIEHAFLWTLRKVTHAKAILFTSASPCMEGSISIDLQSALLRSNGGTS